MWEMMKKLENEYNKNWKRYETTKNVKYLKKCTKITQEKTKILDILNYAI